MSKMWYEHPNRKKILLICGVVVILIVGIILYFKIQDNSFNALTNQVAISDNIGELKYQIKSYAASGYTVGTTTFLRSLHKFMLNFHDVFPKYTGKPIEFGGMSSSFNLGCE